MSGEASDSAWSLHYSAPAKEWVEALPIGNGSMGAMIFGGVGTERIQFNEDTLWTGHPQDYQHPGAAEVLPELRRLLFEGKQKQAQDLAMDRFMSEPLRQCAYQPFGDVRLTFQGHDTPRNYTRSLDLETALASVRYEVNGIPFTRECFASYPDHILAIRLEAGSPGALSFDAVFDCPHEEHTQTSPGADTLILAGRVTHTGESGTESQLRFEARMQVQVQGGTGVATKDGIQVRGATSAVLYLAAATSFVNYQDISGDPGLRCTGILSAIAGRDYETLKQRHTADYQALYKRVAIDLGPDHYRDVDTDKRLEAYRSGNDPHLAAMLFQYGRYLLIASSRPGSQPANLQGLWNEKMDPSWDSKYTTNINAEMNYWPAELTNLSECHEPLFDLIEDCSVTGARTAQTFYALMAGYFITTRIYGGYCAHKSSDHGIWVSGGAWLCRICGGATSTRDLEFCGTGRIPS